VKRVNYHLTEKQIKRLQAHAKKTGLTVAEIIRRAVDEYFERKESSKKAKEQSR
jgi:predicted DNA-binding protein